MPALAAGESGITWPITACMSASATFWYLTMYRPVSSATASTIFMNGPANAMISRCQRGLARKPRGSSTFSSVGLLAGHLDVAAEQDQREAVVGLAAAEPEQPRAEAEAERFHLHIEEAGGPEVAQFVDHDHDPDQDQQPQNVFNKDEHIASSRHSAGRAGRHQFARHGARFPVNLQDIANRCAVSGPASATASPDTTS